MNVKSMLLFVKEEIIKNQKYNVKNLYVSRLKDKESESLFPRAIYRVSYSIFGGGYFIFEDLINKSKYFVYDKDDEFIDIVEFVPFNKVFPGYFYPSLGVIRELSDKLNEDNNILVMRKNI